MCAHVYNYSKLPYITHPSGLNFILKKVKNRCSLSKYLSYPLFSRSYIPYTFVLPYIILLSMPLF